MPLITLEGLDGSGKSTLAQGLVEALRERGATITLLREPGGTALGERVRGLLKGYEPGVAVGDMAELLLFNAARAQLLDELVRPALERGELVLLDRYVDSTFAYQAAGRGLDEETVRAVCAAATSGTTPDLTLLLVVSARVRLQRLGVREGDDRIEQAGDAFFERVRRGYQRLESEAPTRIMPLDADQSPERVLDAALAALSSRNLIEVSSLQ